MNPVKVMRQSLRDRLARRLGVPEISRGLDLLKSVGFEPRLIFDVGAYRGEFTLSCLERWPEATIACFDAQPRALEHLNTIAARCRRVSVYATLLGEHVSKEVPFHESETASSVLAEQQGPQHQLTFRPMTTIDHVVASDFSSRGPSFVKLDVQGYELKVLEGATNSLDSIDVLLSEVNLLDIHDGVPLVAELIAWLNERDFVPYDICGLTRRPLDGALWQADMIFVHKESSFREDKRWQSGASDWRRRVAKTRAPVAKALGI